MNDPLLEQTLADCRATARRVENAVAVLGTAWPGHKPVLEACGRFRRRCEDLATARRLDMPRVAFVGPKKAGKSTLLAGILRDEHARASIPAGSSLHTSTEKLVWIGPQQPVGMDAAVEEYLPCSEPGLPDIGLTCTFADVPGDNEAHPGRELAAARALELALVHVVVVGFSDRRNESIIRLMRRAGRALILPVITKVRPTDAREELVGLQREFSALAPEAKVLEPVVGEDFDHAGTPEGARQRFLSALTSRLADVIAGHPCETLISDKLAGERDHFCLEIAELAADRLRATPLAAKRLEGALEGALIAAVGELLGSRRELRAGALWALRMTTLERTPSWCFPWRLLLSVHALFAGALDRLPLALAGSPVSLGSALLQAAQNIKAGAAFDQAASAGLRMRLSGRVHDALRGQFFLLEDALKQDFGAVGAAPNAMAADADLKLAGIEGLQARSRQEFEHVIETHAPSRAAAFVVAAFGAVVFWGIVCGPLASLYEELARGVRAVWSGESGARALFPNRAGSMLITAILLALFPMGLLSLAATGWWFRRRIVERSLADLEDRHKQLCAEMIRQRELSVRIGEPLLEACLLLLSPKPSAPPARDRGVTPP